MRRTRHHQFIWSVLLVLLAANASAQVAQQQPAPQQGSVAARQVIAINKGWEFRLAPPDPQRGLAGATPIISAADAEALNHWLPAEVPGLVQTDLLRNKRIPDPFYRDNETRLQWIGLEDWQYRTAFNVPDAMLSRRHIDLVFKGLDTYATVFLNDTQLLQADNEFREWRVDAKPYLKAGENRLLIVLRSPINEVLPKIENLPYHLPTPSGPRIVSEKGIPTDIYTRKAPYNYGWDWGPRYVTIGIWKPVLLESWDDAAIRDLHIRQNEVTDKLANICAALEIVADADTPATVTVTYDPPSGKGSAGRAERNVRLHSGTNLIEVPMEIENPARWFPTGYGAQDLYNFHATVAVKNATADETSTRTGLRSIVLRRQPDQWGKSFEFVVNGIPIFGKGADTIPFDSFPTRVTTEQYRRILSSARDANMNMIRSWGGGYYESDEFFDICDELGLMVWQDFMFGGGMYPGNAAFLDNVREEAIYQVRRLRNHPSIVIWCGNNETEVGWYYWGDRKALKESVGPENRERLWQDYMRLFDGVLRRVVAQYGQPVEYWPSSPSANFEDMPNSQAYGDMHYWEVWHARAPIEDYKMQLPRFMTEYGFQSFPEMKTIKTFSLPEDWDIESKIMLAHQKNVGGNARIHDYMLNYFGEPKDFASFLYVSQVLQAEAIKVGAEHLRRQRPRTMGSLYWQLNDCWPVASWASIDYYGRWKALQYYARRFYNDLLVSPNVEGGSTSIYVVSDRTTPTPAKLRVRLMNYAGNVVQEKNQDVTIEPLSSKILLQLPTDTLLSGKSDHYLVAAELLVDGKVASRNLLFLNRMKDVTLPKPRITATIDQAGQNYRVRLQTNALARDVYVSFGDLDATASDNYIDMLPGETAEITVTSKASLADLRRSMQVISLVDAIIPGTGNRTVTTTAARP